MSFRSSDDFQSMIFSNEPISKFLIDHRISLLEEYRENMLLLGIHSLRLMIVAALCGFYHNFSFIASSIWKCVKSIIMFTRVREM